MSAELRCYQCGESLVALTPPISRQDACPACFRHLHVCRMCVYFNPDVPAQCTEDDAEEVFDKLKQNFCDWYTPSENGFNPSQHNKEVRATAELAALFGGTAADEPDTDQVTSAAEDLFR